MTFRSTILLTVDKLFYFVYLHTCIVGLVGELTEILLCKVLNPVPNTYQVFIKLQLLQLGTIPIPLTLCHISGEHK